VRRLIEFGLMASLAASAVAQADTQQTPSIIERAARLSPGEFIWEPEAASVGPVLLVIDLTTQRILLYRGGVPIGSSTISTGSKGRETPTGMFSILQKEVVHRSRTYDDAPMPYMQRLTSRGVAMHAGNLPGYPASHGCIRLPKAFAKLLYEVTELGTPVMITDEAERAEQQRRAAEYQRSIEEAARRKAELEADAALALAEYDRAMALHDEMLRQHKAKMTMYELEVASR
jgi:hypothetical protein